MIDFAEQPGGAAVDVGSVTMVAHAVAKAKEVWIAKCAKKLMPDHVVAWAESKNGAQMAKAAKWLSKRQFTLREHPDGRCRFMQGDKVISEFRTVMNDGKLTFESKNYE
ncbi:MAG: hypothetical protein V4563_14155 [Pseudomonadota bacterium]